MIYYPSARDQESELFEYDFTVHGWCYQQNVIENALLRPSKNTFSNIALIGWQHSHQLRRSEAMLEKRYPAVKCFSDPNPGFIYS